MPTAYRPKPRTQYHKRTEENDQLWLVKYVRTNYPEAIIESDYAAGLNLTHTQRIKLMGLRSHKGMPDVRIYYPSRGYHALILELKKEGTKIYKRDGVTLRKAAYTRKFRRGGKLYITSGDHNLEQQETLDTFNRLGYCAKRAIGRTDAKAIVDWYFDKKQQLFSDELF